MRTIIALLLAWTMWLGASAQTITLKAVNEPVDKVFKEVVRQSGKNFVYTSAILKGKRVSIDLKGASLTDALEKMLKPIGINYTITRNTVVINDQVHPTDTKKHMVSGYVRDAKSKEAIIGAIVRDGAGKAITTTNSNGFYSLTLPQGSTEIYATLIGFVPETKRVDNLSGNMDMDFMLEESQLLNEVTVVGDRNKINSMEVPSIGHITVNASAIKNTPVIFGEADIIKTLQLQPGVSAGTEGLAGMYVHGGNHDENLHLLDEIPLYQINHFGGLFSAFNADAVKNVEFYKTSFPAKYNGRLSSVMEVNTKDGSMTEHHGALKLGLTSGAFSIDGPIVKDRTTYSFAIRRSWYDVLSVPTLAIYNSLRQDKSEKTVAGYTFTDLNGKITHHFSKKSRIHMMVYFGEDYLKGGTKSKFDASEGETESFKASDLAYLRWGNLVVSSGWNYVFNPKFTSNITGAFSRYSASLKHNENDLTFDEGKLTDATYHSNKSKNSITDWILRSDFNYTPHQKHRINFGLNYTYHRFMPEYTANIRSTVDDFQAYEMSKSHNVANEVNAYASDDWKISENVRGDLGLNVSIFNITGKSWTNMNPRGAINWRVMPKLSVKGSYARMSQYVHQLTESSLSLPTDQWIPIANNLKPQTSDKVSIGAYYDFNDKYTLSLEGYYKKLYNVIDFCDEYYTAYPSEDFYGQLTTGSGRAKGIDFMVIKNFGKITGHLSYSLLWSDRLFAEKNGGHRFPSKYDNRHKINVLINWRINQKWEVNASWTGMNGNRYTFACQSYAPLPDGDMSMYPPDIEYGDVALDYVTRLNNYRLPFYHRLDLGVNRYTKHGMWTFSAYNAYCNMNVIALRKTTSYYWVGNKVVTTPKFQKLKLIPIIPSVSYTWSF